MTIQSGEGPIRIDPDDPQISYRGKRVAIKIRMLMWPVILGCVQESDGSWSATADLTNDLFISDVPGGGDPVAYWLAQRGGAAAFVQEVVVPNANVWLAAAFPPSDAPLSPLEQIHAALGSLRFVPQADGTVKAAMP